MINTPEKEINLLEAIIGSMKGEQATQSHGEFIFVKENTVRCEQILEKITSVKAILVFFDTKLLSTDQHALNPPHLWPIC